MHNGYYSAMRNYEIMHSAATWTESEGTTLREVSQKERRPLRDLAHMWT